MDQLAACGARETTHGVLFHYFIGFGNAGHHDNPPKVFRIIWGLGEGFVADVSLLTGELGALQTASITAAFPISFVLLAMAWGLFKSLADDPGAVRIPSESITPDGTRMSQEPRGWH